MKRSARPPLSWLLLLASCGVDGCGPAEDRQPVFTLPRRSAARPAPARHASRFPRIGRKAAPPAVAPADLPPARGVDVPELGPETEGTDRYPSSDRPDTL